MNKPFDIAQGKKSFVHSLILITAVITVFFWVTNEILEGFSLQLTAILLLAFIFTHRLLKPVSFKLAESTISTMAVLLVVFSTGGISSPLFFLNYFLLFELSLLLEPVIPLVLSGTLIFFYFLITNPEGSLLRWAELLAFPFMTPLAFFFGKFYRKEEHQKEQIKGLERKVEMLEEELVEEEINNPITQ